jgi:hypothetical protein
MKGKTFVFEIVNDLWMFFYFIFVSFIMNQMVFFRFLIIKLRYLSFLMLLEDIRGYVRILEVT